MPAFFTPYNKVELVSCFHDIDRRLEVEVRPAAAEALRPYKVRTVKDVLRLPAWPYPHLRIQIERRLASVEVVIEPVQPPFAALPPPKSTAISFELRRELDSESGHRPQYSFKIRGAEVGQNDEIIAALHDDAAALDYACRMVRELRTGGGYNDPRLVVDVLNELGARVLSLPFLAACA